MLTGNLEILDTLNGSSLGQLRTTTGHTVDLAQVRYHREHFTVA